MRNKHITNSNKPLTAFLFLIARVLICGQLSAQETQAQKSEALRINPDQAVDMAIKNNLSLESARISSTTKKRASDLSWNQFIPGVTVGGNLIRDNEKSTASGVSAFAPTGLINNPMISGSIPPGVTLPPGTDVYLSVPYSAEVPQWHVAGSIQASLTISAAMFENMKRLRLDYQTGMIGYGRAKTQLERDVRKAYNSMLLLQENITLLKENFDAAGRRVTMARANYRAGLVPELTLLQAQVAMENMKPMIDQAENGLRLSRAQFAMFLGLPYNTSFELEPVKSETNFISLNVQELISKAASGKPDIQELRHSILLLHSARKAQSFSLLPALTLSWNTTPVFAGDPWKDNWGDNDMWRRSGSFTISLGLRLHSLFPFSQDFQGIKNMNDQITSANIGLAQMIQGTEIEIYNTVLSLEKTRISAEAQTQTINLAERTYRLSEQAYRAGLQDLLQVRNAELELKQARVSMLEQQFNYLNSLLDLEYAIGVPFGTLSSKEIK
ncbi:MAG: TolC family protein [Treponema sp.]|jgi:outer membrane protein TolC|nr:TolC family protein [Treponema sp.]